ncbi:MAG: ABC transporter ATP-binding protein [Proteobacteria bacterium]|nr:ABC transporter ATP-binding protein [Pseudomonadota bacterium]
MAKKFSERFPALVRLIKGLAPYQGRVLGILLLGLIVSAIQPLSVKLTEQIVNELQKGQSLEPRLFRWIPLALIGVFIISGLSKYFYNSLRRSLSEDVIAKYREDLFRKYLLLPLSVLDQKRTGEMLAGLQNDLSQISVGIDTLCVVLKEPFTFFGLMGVAFYCDWKLTLCTLLVAPFVAILFSQTGSAVKRYSTRNLETFSDLMSLGQESLVGSRIVKVFGLEVPLLSRFKEIQNRYLTTIKKSIRVQELATPLVELVGAFLIAGVLGYAGFAASQGSLTSGQLVAFIIAIGLAQMPIKELNNSFLKLRNAEAAAERLFLVLDEKETKNKTMGAKRVSELQRNIRFENVSLVYGDKTALKNISFDIKKGQTAALVGHSGSGKTSIVNALARLYEITSGQIYFDDIPHHDIYLDDLRSLMAFVTQDTFLFNDSIYNNIRYGNPTADRKQVERAAELAHCQEFIHRLSDGFASKVGDRGVMLSGGERQRVAIALISNSIHFLH